jgi:hypothetical protein
MVAIEITEGTDSMWGWEIRLKRERSVTTWANHRASLSLPPALRTLCLRWMEDPSASFLNHHVSVRPRTVVNDSSPMKRSNTRMRAATWLDRLNPRIILAVVFLDVLLAAIGTVYLLVGSAEDRSDVTWLTVQTWVLGGAAFVLYRYLRSRHQRNG